MLVSTPASCINIYVDNKTNYCIFYCLCIKKKMVFSYQIITMRARKWISARQFSF